MCSPGAYGPRNTATPTPNTISVLPHYQSSIYTDRSNAVDYVEKDVHWLRMRDITLRFNAGKNLLLDFEGSDTASVADFYKKFGAISEPFTTLYLNKLRFPFSLVKPLPHHYKLLISK